MTPVYLIFDFDGTIIDSFHTTVEIFNFLAPSFGFRKVHLGELSYLKDLNAEALIKHLRIPAYKVPFIIHQARKCFYSKMKKLRPFDNIYNVLECLYKANIPLGILTTNSEENVRIWLKENNMFGFFNFIGTEPNFFGKKHALEKTIWGINARSYQLRYNNHKLLVVEESYA